MIIQLEGKPFGHKENRFMSLFFQFFNQYSIKLDFMPRRHDN